MKKLNKEEEDEYICVYATTETQDTYPCDFCERERCLGVEECAEEYGENTYFVKKLENEGND